MYCFQGGHNNACPGCDLADSEKGSRNPHSTWTPPTSQPEHHQSVHKPPPITHSDPSFSPHTLPVPWKRHPEALPLNGMRENSSRAKVIWVVKTKPPGDRRFWSLLPLTRVPFWVPMFDPQPFGELNMFPLTHPAQHPASRALARAKRWSHPRWGGPETGATDGPRPRPLAPYASREHLSSQTPATVSAIHIELIIVVKNGQNPHASSEALCCLSKTGHLRTLVVPTPPGRRARSPLLTSHREAFELDQAAIVLADSRPTSRDPRWILTWQVACTTCERTKQVDVT